MKGRGFRPQGGYLFPRGKGSKKPPAPLGWTQLLVVARWVRQRGTFNGGTAKRRARKLAVKSLRLSALHPMAYVAL